MTRKNTIRLSRIASTNSTKKNSITSPNNWAMSTLEGILDPVTPSNVIETLANNQTAIAEWSVPNHEVIDNDTCFLDRDGKRYYYIALQAYHISGIASVQFNLNNAGFENGVFGDTIAEDGTIAEYFYIVPESAMLSGLNEVRAKITPNFGPVSIIQGRDFVDPDHMNGITYPAAGTNGSLNFNGDFKSTTSMYFWKLGASAENVYVNLSSGSDITGSGSQNSPYKSIEGALYRKWQSTGFAGITSSTAFPYGAYILVSGATSPVEYVGAFSATGGTQYPVFGYTGSADNTDTKYIYPPIVFKGENTSTGFDKIWFWGVSGSSEAVGVTTSNNLVTRPVLSSWRNFIFGPRGDLNKFSGNNGATTAFVENIHSNWNQNIRSYRNFRNCIFSNGVELLEGQFSPAFKAFVASNSTYMPFQGATNDLRISQITATGGHPLIVGTTAQAVSGENYVKGQLVFNIGTTFGNSNTALKIPNTFEVAFKAHNNKLYKRDSLYQTYAYGPRVNIDAYYIRQHNHIHGFADRLTKGGIVTNSQLINYGNIESGFYVLPQLGTGWPAGITSATSTQLAAKSSSGLSDAEKRPIRWNYNRIPVIYSNVDTSYLTSNTFGGNISTKNKTKYNTSPVIISDLSVNNTAEQITTTGTNLRYFSYIENNIGEATVPGVTEVVFSKDGATGAPIFSHIAFVDNKYLRATPVSNTVFSENKPSTSSPILVTSSSFYGDCGIWKNILVDRNQGHINFINSSTINIDFYRPNFFDSVYVKDSLQYVREFDLTTSSNNWVEPTTFSYDISIYPNGGSVSYNNRNYVKLAYVPYIPNYSQFYNTWGYSTDYINSFKNYSIFTADKSKMEFNAYVNYTLPNSSVPSFINFNELGATMNFSNKFMNQYAGNTFAGEGDILRPYFDISDKISTVINNLDNMEGYSDLSSDLGSSTTYLWYRNGVPISKSFDASNLVGSTLNDTSISKTYTKVDHLPPDGTTGEEYGLFGFTVDGRDFLSNIEYDNDGVVSTLFLNGGETGERYETGLTYMLKSIDTGANIQVEVTYNHFDGRSTSDFINQEVVSLSSSLSNAFVDEGDRYWVKGSPKIGSVDGPLTSINDIAGFGDNQTDGIFVQKSQKLLNSPYTNISGIIARNRKNYEYKLSLPNNSLNDASHDLLNNFSIFALHNENTGKSIWWHTESSTAQSHLNTYFNTYKNTYILGEAGNTLGFVSSNQISSYTNSTASQLLSNLLNNFNADVSTNIDALVSDLDGDNFVNATDLTQLLLDWNVNSKDDLVEIDSFSKDFYKKLVDSNGDNIEDDIDHTLTSHKIYEFLYQAAMNQDPVIFEFSDSLQKIPFLQGPSFGNVSPSGYYPLNYPAITGGATVDGIYYYVGTSGSNSNAGTRAQPFLTLGKALDTLHGNASFTSTTNPIPGYIIFLDGIYDYDTFGQTYSGYNSGTGKVLMQTKSTPNSGIWTPLSARSGLPTNTVNIVSENWLGAKIRGSRKFGSISGVTSSAGFTLINGITAINFNVNIVDEIKFGSAESAVNDEYSANSINIVSEVFPVPYDYQESLASNITPSIDSYNIYTTYGKNPKRYIEETTYWKLIFSNAPEAALILPEHVQLGQSPSFFGITLNSSTNPATSYYGITYSNGQSLIDLTKGITMYNYFLNEVPAGYSLTNYFNDSTFLVRTFDSNIRGFRILGFDCHNKVMKLKGKATPTPNGGTNPFWKATIIGHPKYIGHTGCFAIGNTFNHGGNHKLYLASNNSNATFSNAYDCRFGVFDNIVAPVAAQNFNIIGFEMCETNSGAIRQLTSDGVPCVNNTFKYNYIHDTLASGISPGGRNTTVESNLFNRCLYRPISSNTSAVNPVIKNNVILNWNSHTGLIINGGTGAVVDGNMLFTNYGIHQNGMAFYAEPTEFVCKNNLIAGTNAVGMAFNEQQNTSEKWNEVKDNVCVSGTVEIRKYPEISLGRTKFEHNTFSAVNYYETYKNGFSWYLDYDHRWHHNCIGSINSSGDGFPFTGNVNSNKGLGWTVNVRPPHHKGLNTYSGVSGGTAWTFTTNWGFTSSLYQAYVNNPEIFNLRLPDPENPEWVFPFYGYKINENFTINNITKNFGSSTGLTDIGGYQIFSPAIFVSPYENPTGVPNHYKNFMWTPNGSKSDLGDNFQTASGANRRLDPVEATPRILCNNIYYSISRFTSSTNAPSDEQKANRYHAAKNYIFVDYENHDWRIKDTAYALPPVRFVDASLPTPEHMEVIISHLGNASADPINDSRVVSRRTQKVNEWTDVDGYGPGIRWDNAPPANPNNWWLWQENVGFYGTE